MMILLVVVVVVAVVVVAVVVVAVVVLLLLLYNAYSNFCNNTCYCSLLHLLLHFRQFSCCCCYCTTHIQFHRNREHQNLRQKIESIRQKIKDDKEESQGWLKANMEDIKDAYMNETGTTHHAILPHHHTKRSDKRSDSSWSIRSTELGI